MFIVMPVRLVFVTAGITLHIQAAVPPWLMSVKNAACPHAMQWHVSTAFWCSCVHQKAPRLQMSWRGSLLLLAASV